MDTAKTLTDIANLALARLGEPPISSIDSTVPSAKVCKRHLPPVMRTEQSAYRWAELLEEWSPDTPLDDLSSENWYQFTLPTRCLRVLELQYEYPYRIMNRTLITSVSTPVVTMLAYNESVNEWSPQLVDTVVIALAIRIAPMLTRGNRKTRELLDEKRLVVDPASRRVQSMHRTSTTYRPRHHRWASARNRRRA